MKFFKNKSIDFYFRMAAAVAGLISAVYYIIQSNVDKCFQISVIILLVLGIAVGAASLFVKIDFLKIISSAAFGVAFGVMLLYALPTFSDIWNNVVFIGGNAAAYAVYLIMIAVAFVLSDISCFISEE